MIFTAKKKFIIFMGLGVYVLFLVSIYDTQVIQNNEEQKINADAYFYSEMNATYFTGKK